MTNWKTFTITSIKLPDNITNNLPDKELRVFGDTYIGLNSDIYYSDYSSSRITCYSRVPFITWQVGDRVEIDIDKIRCMKLIPSSFDDPAANESVIRKISSAVVPSSSGQMSLSREQAEAFADRLVDRVEQSGGQYELDAYIQQGTDPHGTPYTRQGWIYRKK